MKKIILLIGFLLTTILTFSQGIEVNKNGLKYKLKYEKEFDIQTIERFEYRIKSEIEEIESIEIKDNKTIIRFKKNTPIERIEKTLLYVSYVLCYDSYKYK